MNEPTLIMTILVRDEEDVIEKNLQFHKAMGVDKFIVTDNNSTDGTLEILEKYRRMGWIVDLSKELGDDYRQREWVGAMIRKARDEHGADWVINADADEFWRPASGDLKKDILNCDANVQFVKWRNMLPNLDGGPFWHNTTASVKQMPRRNRYGLSRFNQLGNFMQKVVHTAKGFRAIHQGNHNVDMDNRRQAENHAITIYHYSIRNFEQFQRKVVNGGASCDNNKEYSKELCSHWRYWYALHLQGGLRGEYDKVIGARRRGLLFRKGFLDHDRTIMDFFEVVFCEA